MALPSVTITNISSLPKRTRILTYVVKVIA